MPFFAPVTAISLETLTPNISLLLKGESLVPDDPKASAKDITLSIFQRTDEFYSYIRELWKGAVCIKWSWHTVNCITNFCGGTARQPSLSSRGNRDPRVKT